MEDPPASMEEKELEGSVTIIPSSSPLTHTSAKPNITSETMMDPTAGSGANNNCSPALALPAETSPTKQHIPSSSPLVQTTTIPCFPSETVKVPNAVSMANNDCSEALSSPAEAKPAETPPATFDGTIETSPDTSKIASASDSLTTTGTSLINLSEAPSPSLPILPPTTFGNRDQQEDFPNVLTFKGVSITLENNSVWKQFNSCGTEMILTKQGRRMFPYCRYRLAGLDPDRLYSLVLSIVPTDQYRYRWNQLKWEISGAAEHQTQGLIRAFAHHYSPVRGSDWMGSLVSFYKLKLTNNPEDHDGHIILHSMQRYIPRIHVIPVPDGDVFTPDKPVVMGPESMTFTFPQTEFMAVTTYQNFRITQLKINHNPFAKGFREDGNNPRLQRVTNGAHPVVKLDTQSTVLIPAEINENQGAVNLSTNHQTVPTSVSPEQETRLVLKPIMSSFANKDDPYVPCLRGNHALGELVLVQKRPTEEAKEEPNAISVTPKIQKGFRFTPKSLSRTSKFKTSTPASSLGYHKRRKRINRRWANSRGKLWKATDASPTVVHSPSLTVAMQPEMDEVEGLLFVSFTSKEALEVHVGDTPANRSSFSFPESQTRTTEWNQTVEEIEEAEEEKIARLEAALLQNLRVFKHRQVIHPVLQEVGLKLSSLDPNKSVDLKYLGVLLPLPPPNLPRQDNITASGEGLPFISRTGKTNDMTKIKGWRNKFIKKKDSSPSNADGSQKNLSAFCSNMLDEYLESEAQYISERAAAFSTNPEGLVSYQLPAKSSSYVKTLDSVLKHRSVTFPGVGNRPCPLSHKRVHDSGGTSEVQESTAEITTKNTSGSSQRLSTYLPGVSQRPVMSFGQNQGMTHKPPGFTKSQFNLLQMELGAMNEGLHRTQLTQDRLSVALSVILTKQMQPSQLLKMAQYPNQNAEGPECGQDFCILGCVCSSLQNPNRGPLHCQQPDCMFDCTCFKGKITKQTTTGESELQTLTNMDPVVQSCPGSHAKKLWKCDIRDKDTDPLSAPKMAPLWTAPAKAPKRSFVPCPIQLIKEEDKSPVYKYFESMMTCARVRGYRSKTPPEVTEPRIPDPETPNPTEEPQDTSSDNLQKHDLSSGKNVHESEETTSHGSTVREAGVKKKIEIQSVCQWDKDRKMILEALYGRMMQNRLSRRFYIGPYRIHPLTKISIRKPSGSVVTYRVKISKPSKASDIEDQSDDSDEDNHVNKSLFENTDAELENSQVEKPEMHFGVTPFLSGVTPAGRLRARTKSVGSQANGLIQVNGKSYNQARLLLGNMGSLHPANRLAAYVTGRLKAPADIHLKTSEGSEPTNKTSTLGGLHIKAAGTVVPPIINARKTTDLKTPAQPPAKLFQPDLWRKGSVTLPQNSLNPSSINPVKSFTKSQLSSLNPLQSSSVSQPVSLTVSPALKTPSFLGQSGTYSFRICPPANQGTAGKNLPGVSLPGGFTLIQLPKPGGKGAVQHSQSVNTTNTAAVGRAPPQKPGLFNSGHSAPNLDTKWLEFDIFARAKELSDIRSAQPGAFTKQMFDEKMRSVRNERFRARKGDFKDNTSEDLSSDFSDYDGEIDNDDELVDIETVEEVGQGMAIAKMKEAVRMALQDSRDTSAIGLISKLAMTQLEEQIDEGSKDIKRRTSHTVLERQRRSEMRDLYDKLQTVLKSDPKAPRLRLLSLAVNEIQNLVETSKSLEEQKRRQESMQSFYLKKLSTLSGKPDEQIKHKLKQVFEKQKIRETNSKWKPFFSNLLQSRAALLEATSPESKLQPPMLSDLFTDKSRLHPLVAAALETVQKKPTPKPNFGPLAVFSEAMLNFNATPPQAKTQPGDPKDPEDEQPHEKETVGQQETADNTLKPQTKLQQPIFVTTPQVTKAATPQVTEGQAGAPPVSSSSKKPGGTPKPVPLPLIRSKTGRIILPASLKPLGQGYYTLMIMKPKEDGAGGGPSDLDPSKSKDKNPSEYNQLPTLENIPMLRKCVPTTKPQPKPQVVPTAKGDHVVLNKQIIVPLVDLKTVKKRSTEAGEMKTHGAARLTFEHVRQVPTYVVEPKPDPDPPAVRRSKGRPRKHPLPRVGENAQHAVTCESESEPSILIADVKPEKEPVEVTKTQSEDYSPPVKRGRGRPRKDKKKEQFLQMWRPPPNLTRRTRPKSEDSSDRFSGTFQSPDAKCKTEESPSPGHRSTSRPLTRGALGKDFPSAKRRSWIDVEKELEPELEYEVLKSSC
ncbi:MAX gene-associated protein [Labrus bergylta]|uniref:MAX gene-associated protein-like n=1 Tax=Labrus bergylta TaxID=56723 RepID=A0A3Q3GJY5_9LABR|nr:MAX gene-associated protein-like [Labrus bergylta]